MVLDTPERSPNYASRARGCNTAISADYNFCIGSQPRQQPQHGRFRHRNAACGRPEISACQMQEYRAAAACDARRAVVIDLDDKIIEVVVAPEAVAVLGPIQPDGLVVMAACGVFTPGVVSCNRANR